MSDLMSFIVKYQHPGLGPNESVPWGRKEDAEGFVYAIPAEWAPKIEESRRTPAIFPHCGPEAQAVGGRCPACRKILTWADARRWDEKNEEDTAKGRDKESSHA